MSKQHTGIEAVCVSFGLDFAPMFDTPNGNTFAGIWIASGAKLWLVGQDDVTGLIKLSTKDGAFTGWMLTRNLRLGHYDRAEQESDSAESPTITDTDIGSPEPFCACGRRWSQCDGSRRGCGKR